MKTDRGGTISMQENHKTTIDMYIDLPFRDGTHGPSGCYAATDYLRVELCGTACCFVGPTERERETGTSHKPYITARRARAEWGSSVDLCSTD